jgi:hypothetical protein
MFANVIHANSPLGFDYLVYPEQSFQTQQYLQQQVSNFSNSLTGVDRAFMEQSQHLYEHINNSAAVRAAKAALRSAKALFHPNTIVQLDTIEELRAAQPVMQRWIMAEPTIREYYHNNGCDGYYGTYVDNDPGKTGWNHYDYRRVMDTVVQFDEDDNWVARNIFEELLPDDRDLTFDEKVRILNSWDIMRMFMEAGEDVSNPEGGELNKV